MNRLWDAMFGWGDWKDTGVPQPSLSAQTEDFNAKMDRLDARIAELKDKVASLKSLSGRKFDREF